MATDIQKIIDNLTVFYDFSGKNVIHVGAGGGQIIAYAHLAKSVLAMDTDADAVEHLRNAVSMPVQMWFFSSSVCTRWPSRAKPCRRP
jgi:predicted RNA methylase